VLLGCAVEAGGLAEGDADCDEGLATADDGAIAELETVKTVEVTVADG